MADLKADDECEEEDDGVKVRVVDDVRWPDLVQVDVSKERSQCSHCEASKGPDVVYERVVDQGVDAAVSPDPGVQGSSVTSTRRGGPGRTTSGQVLPLLEQVPRVLCCRGVLLPKHCNLDVGVSVSEVQNVSLHGTAKQNDLD